MSMTAKPESIKNKSVTWDHFDRLLNCFKNDTRVFFVNDANDYLGKRQSMTLGNIINLWDGGIESLATCSHMLTILEAAVNLKRNDKIVVHGWFIKRST